MVSETIFDFFYEDGHQWTPNYGKCSDSFWPGELKKKHTPDKFYKILDKIREKKLQVPLNYLVFKSF